jgi:hypothetical protein
MSRRLLLVVYVFTLLVLVAGLLVLMPPEDAIDCGPEGKLALDGKACISKEPVMIP